MTTDLEKIEKWVKQQEAEAHWFMPQNKDDLVVRSHTLLNFIQSLKEEKIVSPEQKHEIAQNLQRQKNKELRSKLDDLYKQLDKGEMALEILRDFRSTASPSEWGASLIRSIDFIEDRHKEKGDE